MIGAIEGTKVGQAFRDRQELHDAGIHRPTQAGIASRAAEGAETIVLSGGYVDDCLCGARWARSNADLLKPEELC